MPEKSTDDPTEESVTEDPEEEPITEDSKRTLSLGNLKRTLSLRTIRSFSTLNDFCVAKNSFWLFGVFLVYLVYYRVGNEDKFSYKNFGLGRPRFHAIVS